MIKFNGKEYRNLEEQVRANMEAIEEIHDIGLLLAQLGIKVVGQVDTAEELPDPTEYYADDRENHYGDAYAVGATTPYYFYLFTRPFEGETDPKWFSIGQFPLKGPKGDPGAGEGVAYNSARIDISNYSNPDLQGTLTLTDSDNQQTVLPLATNRPWDAGEGVSISTDNATGVTRPSVSLWRHHITMSENQTKDGIDYEGVDFEFDIISSKSYDQQNTGFSSWNNLCNALKKRSTNTLRVSAAGRYCSSPYSGAYYSNVFVTTVEINPNNGTITAYGRRFATTDADFYDYPLKTWSLGLTKDQCSFMAFSDSVRPFPDTIDLS